IELSKLLQIPEPTEAIHYSEQALEVAISLDDEELQLKSIMANITALYSGSQLPSALCKIKEARSLAKNLNDNACEAKCLHFLGMIATGRGKFQQAIAYTEE